jgi:cell division protein FtsI (penicillin-binding protein 3)
MNDNKKYIMNRTYVVYVGVCLFAFAVLFQLFKVQYVEGDKWRAKAKELTTQNQTIEASRGNIFASDGSLLATSLPIYELRMDMMSDAVTDKIFNKNIDSLSIELSNLFKDKTKEGYKKELKRARRSKERYHLVQRGVRYTQLKAVKKFHIINLGKYKGGLIVLQQDKREQPFKNLAIRTIGYDRVGGKPVGIEGKYNEYLVGQQGNRLMQKIAGSVWMPINSENEIEPRNGADVTTTIDVNIQDVAQHALITNLKKHKAHHGCVIVMEVATGHIKAMANYTRKDTATYLEQYNYAIGEATEPGSTFKLASYLIAIDDGYIKITDTIDAEGGRKKFYDRIIRDSHDGTNRISVQHAFETSSNVAIAKIISKYYAKNPRKFTDKLYSMNLNMPTGIDLNGEAKPRIKNPKDKDWYGTSLPYMAHGYELTQTPLQTLTLYNAVANNGVMVQPMLIKDIQRSGTMIKKFNTTIINNAICKQSTIRQLRKMLEGVVQQGSAQNLKTNYMKIAGKTGTAVMASSKGSYNNTEESTEAKAYQASFAGYFPAENPVYSCIVVVNNPSGKFYYGNVVAGPIFKEVADKIYATQLNLQTTPPTDTVYKAFKPLIKTGNSNDFATIMRSVLHSDNYTSSSDWVKLDVNNKTVHNNKADIVFNKKSFTNLIGMGARDAVYLLENKGYSVIVRGKGSVRKVTSIPSGTSNNKKVIIELA